MTAPVARRRERAGRSVVVWSAILCMAASAGTASAAEHYRVLGRFGSGIAYVVAVGQYYHAVNTVAAYRGPANNDNDQGAATWSRLGRRSSGERSSVVEHYGLRIVDDSTVQCVDAFAGFSRYRTSGVAAPGSLCNTYSGPLVGAASVSIDTCTTSLGDKTFWPNDLSLSFTNAGGAGLTGFRSTVTATQGVPTSPGYETSSSEGCYAIMWEP